MSLNLRLIALVVALLAVTIGGIAVISTRVAHVEIRKIEIQERRLMLRQGESLQAFFERVRAHEAPSDVVMFDGSRRLVASTMRNARVSLDGKSRLIIESPGGVRRVLRDPYAIVRDRNGSEAGAVFVVPREPEEPLLARTRTLDRSFFWIFTGAALFGVVMAVLIARWLTVPIERLTTAARQMEKGDFGARVAPAGGPELSDLARAFNAMAEALDRNEELRRRMVSDVAHELRAPLTNIRCELESMQDGLSLARVDSLHEEVMHLTRLVDDVQDLALAEAGKLEMHPEPVALAPLMRRIAPIAEGPDDLTVLADPTRLTQILTNLISNAVRHAEEVRVVWRREGDEALIQVIDNGSGIPPEDLPRVFDRFYRVDAARGRNTGGAGLGLSLVKQLVAAQGGRVWGESTVGKGSTFSFTLPLAPKSLPPQRESAE